MTHLPASFVDILRGRAEEQPRQLAYRYLVDGEYEEIIMTYSPKTEERKDVVNMIMHVVGVDVGGTNTGAYFLFRL